MDTVTAFAQHRQKFGTEVATATIDANRTLAVTATYLLSEEGRKASLLAGGDGRAVQELTVQVPTNRLHLVSVDANGVARLKLRPRYELNGEQHVVRIDAPPTYDSPPEIEDLFREAARNHQLERAFETERRSAKAKRRETDRERRTQLATSFLNDPAQRALVHPPPTPKRCYAPLDAAPMSPDVVLVRGNARQLMLLAEAAQAAGVAGTGPTMGRPTCAVLPEAINAARTAGSFGCIGNRVYTGATDDDAYFAIPGGHLRAVEEKLAVIVRANQELEQFHRARAAGTPKA
jgi:hypothetical protein